MFILALLPNIIATKIFGYTAIVASINLVACGVPIGVPIVVHQLVYQLWYTNLVAFQNSTHI